MFGRPKDSMKGKCYVFGGYKMRNKVYLVDLEWKLQEATWNWWILNLKCQKTVELTYSGRSKNKQGTADVFRC